MIKMSLELHNALQQLALLLFGLFFLFIFAATYYARLVRKKYRRVSLIDARFVLFVVARSFGRDTLGYFSFPLSFFVSSPL